MDSYLENLTWNCPQVNVTEPYDDKLTLVQVMAVHAFTWDNVGPDPSHLMAKPGYKELIFS